MTGKSDFHPNDFDSILSALRDIVSERPDLVSALHFAEALSELLSAIIDKIPSTSTGSFISVKVVKEELRRLKEVVSTYVTRLREIEKSKKTKKAKRSILDELLRL